MGYFIWLSIPDLSKIPEFCHSALRNSSTRPAQNWLPSRPSLSFRSSPWIPQLCKLHRTLKIASARLCRLDPRFRCCQITIYMCSNTLMIERSRSCYLVLKSDWIPSLDRARSDSRWSSKVLVRFIKLRMRSTTCLICQGSFWHPIL